MPGPKPLPLTERIRRLSDADETGCWIWQGAVSNRGYGKIMLRNTGKLKCGSAHRVSYEAFVGPIPDGLVIDHLCRVRLCVNPAHLEPVTMRENTMRSPITQGAINAAKTHCPRGHEYDGFGVLRRNGTTRIRWCRTCSRSRQAVSA